MGKIFCVMGKSASGKDTIYNKILQDDSLMLSRIIPYTTRPIRDGETQDKDYHFCNEEDVKRLSAQERIIELREYNTVYGVWKYFTGNDDDIDLRCNSYLTVGPLESYTKLRDYFGSDKVLPIYVEVEDGARLIRAIHREKGKQVPKIEEMSRRLLSAETDYTKEKKHKAGIPLRFINDDMDTVLAEISAYIRQSS